MAKGQRKSNREVRKPKKAELPKQNAALTTLNQSPVPNLVNRV